MVTRSLKDFLYKQHAVLFLKGKGKGKGKAIPVQALRTPLQKT